jgi:hypothetical protein
METFSIDIDGFTLGTVLVGSVLAAYVIAQWYPGRKALIGPKWMQHAGRLLPFLLSWCVGALSVMCVGGLVGVVSDLVVYGAGWLGDAALVWGVGGRRTASPAGVASPLTQGGLFVTCIVLAVFAARWSKGEVRDKRFGLLSGICMGMSAGAVRLLAVPLASTVNLAGAWATGVIV